MAKKYQAGDNLEGLARSIVEATMYWTPTHRGGMADRSTQPVGWVAPSSGPAIVRRGTFGAIFFFFWGGRQTVCGIRTKIGKKGVRVGKKK